MCCYLLRFNHGRAQVVIMALGGSTNAVLHLIAMARSADVDLALEDFQVRYTM